MNASRRRVQVGLAALAAAAVLLAARSLSPRPDRSPNLVIFSVDTLAFSALRAFSDAAGPLPNLDRFASESVRCTSAYTTAPWTLPAHASLLTGLYPDRHGATHFKLRISSPEPSLPETLREAGYQTVAFTGGGFVHWRFGFDRGFESYDDVGSTLVARIPLVRRYLGPFRYGMGSAFERAGRFLAERTPGGPPLFLFLHTYSVHDYFKTGGAEAAERARQCLQAERVCDAAQWQRLRGQYAARLRDLDRDFGGLLAALAPLLAEAPTYVIVLSDHGEGFDYERKWIHHGGQLHRDVIRVPLLIRGPGLVPRDVSAPISLADILPTSLELLDLPATPGLDGRSVASALGGGPDSGRRIYAMDHLYRWEPDGRRTLPEPPAKPLSIAVIENGLWYISSGGREEMYELGSDPEQRIAVPVKGAGLTLRRAAEERLGRIVRPTSAAQVDEALREQLRALGYVN